MKLNSLIISFVLLIQVLIVSCNQPSELYAEEYIQFVKDAKNGLVSEHKIGAWHVSLTYLPVDFFKAQQQLNLSQQQIEADSGEQTTRYFLLTIKSDEKEQALTKDLYNKQEFFERINQMLGSMQQQVQFISATDTIPCALHIFERNYNLDKEQHVMLMFDIKEEKLNPEFKIQWNDQILNFGKLNFTFNYKDIKQTPSLII
ncbi:MAG: hypothetical protein MUC81_12070 [Bacteroidia bacterium]|jgi:hypothetical protein|nr:hypothetical protein [Bacteroidia bacterium]